MSASRPDLYISADIEADGPIPGPYSMLSVGLCQAARYDGTEFETVSPTDETFYAELKPISERFDPAALEVSRLDRERLHLEGVEPSEAMDAASAWVRTIAGDDRPVLVAFPAAFDWTFIYWYFVSFSSTGSPFSFSSCLDMKTMFQQLGPRVMDEAGRDDLPAELRPGRRHTHQALDDAIEQAEVFQRLWIERSK